MNNIYIVIKSTPDYLYGKGSEIEIVKIFKNKDDAINFCNNMSSEWHDYFWTEMELE